jgi:peroxiredoxin
LALFVEFLNLLNFHFQSYAKITLDSTVINNAHFPFYMKKTFLSLFLSFSLSLSLSFFLSLAFSTQVLAGDSISYQLKFQVKGLKAKNVLLGYYFGDKTFLVDSVAVDTLTGSFSYQNKKKIAQGMYFAVVRDGRLFDFLLSNEPSFSIVAEKDSLYKSAVITGSKENEAYFKYMGAYEKMNATLDQIEFTTQMLRRATKDAEVMQQQQDRVKAEYTAQALYADRLRREYPNTLFAKIISCGTTPEVPKKLPQKLENGKINPAYFRYYKAHFWDNFDFSDERLLYTKIYDAKVKTYLERLTAPKPDSVIVTIDPFLKKIENNSAYYQYTIKHWTATFEEAPMIGADVVFVHLYDEYHKKNPIKAGTDKTVLSRLEYKAEAFRPSLTGSIAPEIRLKDSAGVYQSLRNLKSDYTLLVFYSPLCSHCQEWIPKVYEVSKKFAARGVTAFAVSTLRGDRTPWLNFIKQHHLDWINVMDELYEDQEIEKKFTAYNLPVVFLLDKNKKILAKRIPLEEVEKYLNGLVQ